MNYLENIFQIVNLCFGIITIKIIQAITLESISLIIERGEKMKKILEQKLLRRLKLDFQDLMGTITVEELKWNKKLQRRYIELHQDFVEAV